MFFYQETNADNWMRFMREGDNKITFESYLSNSYNSKYSTTNTWTPSTGGWHHLAFVRNGNTGSIFIDGYSQAVTVGTAFNTIPNYAGNFRIGAQDQLDYLITSTAFSTKSASLKAGPLPPKKSSPRPPVSLMPSIPPQP